MRDASCLVNDAGFVHQGPRRDFSGCAMIRPRFRIRVKSGRSRAEARSGPCSAKRFAFSDGGGGGSVQRMGGQAALANRSFWLACG